MGEPLRQVKTSENSLPEVSEKLYLVHWQPLVKNTFALCTSYLCKLQRRMRHRNTRHIHSA